jgi:hypothetical protein
VNLAEAMSSAERNLRDIEAKVEVLLSRLFVAWKGWQFTPADPRVPSSVPGIDVYEAQDSRLAAEQLHRVGFLTVTIHGHRSARFLSCTCVSREKR